MAAVDATAPLLAERQGATLTLTLNRPESRNAINVALAEALADQIDAFDADPDLVVAVITGTGRGFCSGMDLKAFVDGERPWIRDRGFAGMVERPPIKPVIAAVEGFAVAGGLEIVLACDIVVAARGAKLGIPEVQRSLVASGGALLRLQQRIPHGAAMRLALTGQLITAERGAELGLVDELVEPGEAAAAAQRLAALVAANGPLAVQATKTVLQGARDWTSEAFWPRQKELVDPVTESEDAHEGAVAFAEKRDPVWHGR